MGCCWLWDPGARRRWAACWVTSSGSSCRRPAFYTTLFPAGWVSHGDDRAGSTLEQAWSSSTLHQLLQESHDPWLPARLMGAVALTQRDGHGPGCGSARGFVSTFPGCHVTGRGVVLLPPPPPQQTRPPQAPLKTGAAGLRGCWAAELLRAALLRPRGIPRTSGHQYRPCLETSAVCKVPPRCSDRSQKGGGSSSSRSDSS